MGELIMYQQNQNEFGHDQGIIYTGSVDYCI